MGSLYAAFDTLQDDQSSSGRRGFKPDEMMDRRMIAAINDKPSVICTWCGNRVRLECTSIQPGGWLAQDYYICTACRKYGNPNWRPVPGYENSKVCADCGTKYIYTPYLKDHTDGTVRCQHCADLVPGHHLMTVAQKIADRRWWVVLPLQPEHECGVCHEFKPDVPLYDWAPWLRKTGIAHVCNECNQIASEV